MRYKRESIYTYIYAETPEEEGLLKEQVKDRAEFLKNDPGQKELTEQIQWLNSQLKAYSERPGGDGDPLRDYLEEKNEPTN